VPDETPATLDTITMLQKEDVPNHFTGGTRCDLSPGTKLQRKYQREEALWDQFPRRFRERYDYGRRQRDTR
jgi:uncharacterized protein YeaO (DUF488 family)